MFFQTFLLMSDVDYGTDKSRKGSEEPISLLEVMVCISCTPPLDFILSFYLNPFSSLCVSASPNSVRYSWPLLNIFQVTTSRYSHNVLYERRKYSKYTPSVTPASIWERFPDVIEKI